MALAIQRIDTRQPGSAAAIAELRAKLAPSGNVVSEAARQKTIAVFGAPLTPSEVVARICADVRMQGLAAVLRYSTQLDGASLSAATLRVPAEELAAAHAQAAPEFLAAIRRIRERGLRTAALTNNWRSGEPQMNLLGPHFDTVVESAVEGMRKPDPRIYELACERLCVRPVEAVFLDDIGRNLKTARQLGMATIKVDDPDQALGELEALLGFALR